MEITMEREIWIALAKECFRLMGQMVDVVPVVILTDKLLRAGITGKELNM